MLINLSFLVIIIICINKMYNYAMNTKIDHIAMYVDDLEGAKNFFLKYFDATCSPKYHNPSTDFKSYYISFNGDTRLEIMTKPLMEDRPKHLSRTGFIHLCISVGDKETVDSLSARLQEDGYKIISGPRRTGDGYYESCIIAFEDNQIEITI